MPLSEFISLAGAVPGVLSSPDGVRATLQNCRWLQDCPAERLDRLGYSFTMCHYDKGSRMVTQVRSWYF